MSLARCDVCQGEFAETELFNASLVRPSIQTRIKTDVAPWSTDSKICNSCLESYRVKQLQDILAEDIGDLTELDERVLESLNEHEVVTKNINAEFEEKITFGQRLSDRMASFGGSWFFLSFFAVFLVVWIALNIFGPKPEIFDPYPYILLNLILSCLAAIQAPIIMMSQNRQEAKDRMRSEHDYLINLKAELEIRQLHMKMDQLLKHQWHRLLEIQQMQVEIMSENLKRAQAKPPQP